MTGKTHIAIGAATGLGVMAIAGAPVSVALVALAAFGALIPDIDHHNSKISTCNIFMKAVSWIVRKIILPVEAILMNVLASLLGAIGLPFSKAVSSHRGPLTHSFVGVALLSLFILPIDWFVSYEMFIFIVIGMCSHVCADTLNPEGAPLLYPFTDKKISLLPHALAVTTGTSREVIIKYTAVAFAILFATQLTGVALF